MMTALRGPKLDGSMAPEIDLSKQRPAEFVFSRHVQKMMADLKHTPKKAKAEAADAAD